MRDEGYIVELLQAAKQMTDRGADKLQIAIAFAEAGVDDDIIDEVLDKLKKYRRSIKRAQGLKQLLYGTSIFAAGIITLVVGNFFQFEYAFIFYGVVFTGFSMMAYGFVNILIP